MAMDDDTRPRTHTPDQQCTRDHTQRVVYTSATLIRGETHRGTRVRGASYTRILTDNALNPNPNQGA